LLTSTCPKAASLVEAMSGPALEAVLRRDRAVVAAALAVITALAWAYTVWLAAGMNMGGEVMSHASGDGAMLSPAFKPWTAFDFAFMFVMWVVMMVGMMVPSAAPMILLYARIGRQAAREGRPLAATGFFAGGYLLAWALFSLIATVGQWMMERAVLLTPMIATGSDVLGGLVLVAAGLFQWTPFKDACLKHCQAPLMFIQRHGGFRRDQAGSLRIGLLHGTYCVGCCWALMALLFVGGVMNIVWIAILTIFVLLEKIIPAGRLVSRTAGLALMAWGAWLVSSALV